MTLLSSTFPLLSFFFLLCCFSFPFLYGDAFLLSSPSTSFLSSSSVKSTTHTFGARCPFRKETPLLATWQQNLYVKPTTVYKRYESYRLYATEDNTATQTKSNTNTNIDKDTNTNKEIETVTSTSANAVVESEQQEQELQERERPKYGIFNINTKGGVLIWGTIAILAGIGLNYLLQTDLFGLDYNQAGLFVSTGVMGLAIVGWTGSYLFRVVNKDMTYAQQLKDYEDAVLMKRLEELQDDEVEALLEEVDVEE